MLCSYRTWPSLLAKVLLTCNFTLSMFSDHCLFIFIFIFILRFYCDLKGYEQSILCRSSPICSWQQ
ncbi:hypothetical protein Peur_064157 [Populus x canadensis]